MKDCVFCKIAAKEIPSFIVYEDSKVLAFLDISPANKGHVLVIPKQHYIRLEEIPDSVLAEISKVIKQVSKAILKALKTKDFNLVQSNGSLAGQFVMHAHFHIIPRFERDGLNLGRLNREPYKYDKEEAKNIANKIRQAMTI